MAIDKRLQVFDAEGNPVDYDILATDVKFNDGEDLPTKLAELEEEIGEGGYNPPEGGIPATDLAPAVQTSLGKADTAVQPGDLSAVATSGNYNDLSNKPTIPDVSGLATKTELNTGLADKVDKETGKSLMSDSEHTKLQNLPSNPVQSVTINGTTPTVDASGNVNLGNVQGQKGDKGDTGNCTITGDGSNIVSLIVNDLTTGGAGNILSAEMGKRLALTTGTYEQAWQRSKVITGLFSFIWDEMGFKKPIWHVGNSVFVDAAGGIVSAAQAANVPADPTFTSNGSSISDNSSVAKNTQVTITPATNSVLYYRIGSSGDYTASLSAVTLTLATAGSVVLSAYCVNTKGNSNTSTLNLTVEGTQVPTFTAKTGTTIDNNDVVSRGGYVVITGAVGGTLKYKVGSASSYTEVAGVGDTAPSAEVQITGATTIKAYNVVDGDDSDEITKNYTMAALAAPILSPASSQLPAGGGTVEITAPAGASIYYTTDGSTPSYTDQNTHNGTLYTTPISVTEGKTIKAIAVDNYGTSAVTTETYTVPVDHKFQFKIKLTGDNSTEYVPVTGNNGPQYHFTVDWGDNTPQETIGAEGAPVGKANKSVGHQYTGTAGTEFTITLRGTSIPVLVFNNAVNGCCNIGALSAIVDNTLDCDTNFYGGFAACTGLESICANALQNNTNGYVSFRGTALTSVPDGLLSHLTKSGVNLTSCFRLFQETNIVLTASQVAELKAVISHVTNFEAMFYGFLGSFAFPDDFFDGISADTITTLENMTHNAGAHVSGDAKKLYDSLVSMVKSNATTTRAFNATGLSNRSQVPTTWGGTMS